MKNFSFNPISKMEFRAKLRKAQSEGYGQVAEASDAGASFVTRNGVIALWLAGSTHSFGEVVYSFEEGL